MHHLYLVVLLLPYVSENTEAFLTENIIKSNIFFASSDHRSIAFIQDSNRLYLFSQSNNDLVGSMSSLLFSSFQSKAMTLQTPIDTSFSFSSISQLSPVNNAIVTANNNIDNKMYFTSEFTMSPYNNSITNDNAIALIALPNTVNKNILSRIKRKIIRVVGHIPSRVRNGLLNNNHNKSPIKKKKNLLDRLKNQIAKTWLGDDVHNTRRWENAINTDVIGSGIFVSSKPIRKKTEIINYQNDTQKHRLRDTYIFMTNPLREVIRKIKDHKNHKNEMQLHLFGNNKDIPIFDSNERRKVSATVSGWQSQSTSMEKYSPLSSLSNKPVPDRNLQRIGISDSTGKKFSNIPTSTSNIPHPHPMEFAKSLAQSIFSIAAESGYSLQLAIVNHNTGATARPTTDSSSSPKTPFHFELKFPEHHFITAAKDTLVNATSPIHGYYNSASDFVSSLTSWTKNDFVWDLNYRPEIPFFEPFTKLLSFNNNNLESGIPTEDSSIDEKKNNVITTNLVEDEQPNLFAEDIQSDSSTPQSSASAVDTVDESRNGNGNCSGIPGSRDRLSQSQSQLTSANERISVRRGNNILSVLFPLISPFARYDGYTADDTDFLYETSIDYRGGTTTTTTSPVPRSVTTATILSFPFSLLRRILSFLPVIRLIPLLLFPESVTVEFNSESSIDMRRRGRGSSSSRDLVVDVVEEVAADSPPVPVSVTTNEPAVTVAGDSKTLEYSPYLPPKVARQIMDGVIARAGQNSTYFDRSVDPSEEGQAQQKMKQQQQQQNQLLPFTYGLEPQMSIDDSIAVKLGRSPELRNRPAFISKERIPIPTKGDFALLKARRLQSVISAAINVVSEEDVSNFLTFISMTPLIEALTIPLSSDYSPDMRINATKGICHLIRSNRNIAADLAANAQAVSVLSELIEAPLKGFKTFRSAPDKERDLRGQREAVALVQRMVRSSSRAVELLQLDDRLRKALVSVATQPDLEASFLSHDLLIPLLAPKTQNSKSDPTKSAANKALKKKGLPVIVDFNKLKVSEMARVAAWGLGGLPWKPKLPAQRGLRILCFDGGGTRGVLSVAVLKELMSRAGKTSPYGMFDIICGTSTGGIIATLLGVKLRGIDEVETLYDNLVVKIFSKKSNLRLATDQALYDEVEWEKILYTICGDELLVDSNQKEEVPRVFCVSASLSTNPPKPVLWRNYNYPPGQSSRYPGAFQVNTDMAVRATTSAPTFFKPVFFNNSFYCDGAIVANNPAAISLQEAKALYPGIPVELVVSIGTGIHNGVSKSNVMGWDTLVNNFIAATVDTEDPHYLLENFLSPEQYYRFNPVLKENYPIDITDSKILNSLKQSAKEYFTEMEMNDGKKLEQLIKLMRGR